MAVCAEQAVYLGYRPPVVGKCRQSRQPLGCQLTPMSMSAAHLISLRKSFCLAQITSAPNFRGWSDFGVGQGGWPIAVGLIFRRGIRLAFPRWRGSDVFAIVARNGQGQAGVRKAPVSPGPEINAIYVVEFCPRRVTAKFAHCRPLHGVRNRRNRRAPRASSY